MGAPFGFTGFLGVASFIGVIASHVIVLFDFIEEKHVEGEALEQVFLDAGIMRLRPVLITVGAGGGFSGVGTVGAINALARQSLRHYGGLVRAKSGEGNDSGPQVAFTGAAPPEVRRAHQ